MNQKRTKEQIAKSVFMAFPHINKVWVDESAHLFYLNGSSGGELINREDIISPSASSLDLE